MADKIAGVPKKWLIPIGAVAAGILGYAWYTRGSTGGAATVDPIEAAADEYDSPLGNSGTNSTATVDNTDPEAIDTNGEWVQAAVAYLQSVGVDAARASAALGKLLAFKPLDAFEASVAQQAKAAFGEPPDGGPYPIKEALPSTTPALTAPTNLRIQASGPTTFLVDWTKVPGANGYEVGVSGGGISKKYFPLYDWDTVAGLKPNTKYTITVHALAPGKTGPKSSITATTKK